MKPFPKFACLALVLTHFVAPGRILAKPIHFRSSELMDILVKS